MTLARVRRPTCEARSAARKASPNTYTPPWKYRTTWRGSIPSMVISAGGTPPSAAAVPGTAAGQRPRGGAPRGGGGHGHVGGQRLRGGQLPEQPPLLADVAVEREGGLPQDCVELLS